MDKTARNPNIPDLLTLLGHSSPSTPVSTPSKSPHSEFVDFFSVNTPTDPTAHNSPASEGGKLSEVLSVLDTECEENVFIVRRISRLGHTAYTALSTYFSSFGRVKRILLLPSRGKGDSRSRPASMGFVVMEDCLDCAIICQSDSYKINYVEDIRVEKFYRNAKVQVTDGTTVTNAYVPASYLEGAQRSQALSMPVPVVTISEVEQLAESMMTTLRL